MLTSMKNCLHIVQHVMYQDSASTQWHPGIITSFSKRNKAIWSTTRDGVTYQKTQTHLKPYTPQNKMVQLEYNQALPDPNSTQLTTSQPKWDIKAHVKCDL